MNQIGAAWEAYTPTIEQSVGLTYSAAYTKYARIQNLVIVSFSCQITSAGTAGAGITVSVPFAAAGSFRPAQSSQFYDASAATTYINVTYMATSTKLGFINSASGGGAFGAAPAVTAANGDYIFGTVIYEAA
jgi:hypothetical protein